MKTTDVKEQTPNEKKSFIIKTVLLAVFTLAVILSLVFSDALFGEASVFYNDISENSVVNAIYKKIPALIRSIQIIVIAVLISMAVRWLMRKSLARSKRGITIVKLLDSFIKYLIAIVALLMVLGAWGVDTATLLASAGILGLVVGLGAQSLIADIIAGMFIVFEGSYQVGDIVVIDDWRGTVDEIGIRTTKIKDAGGNIKVINNSAISSVINQTKNLSWASITVGIEYGESLERVENVIKDNLEDIKSKIPSIVEGPFYKGVASLGASSVDLKILAKCREEDIYSVQRELNRAVKLMFDKNNINIPFTQVVVNQPISFSNTEVTKSMAQAAQKFSDEQQELTKGFHEEEEK